MCFGTQGKLNNINEELTVKLNSDTVGTVTQFKYLGMIVDRQLTFDKHVDYMHRKIFAEMKMFGKLRQYISRKLALQMYRTFILPDFLLQ